MRSAFARFSCAFALVLAVAASAAYAQYTQVAEILYTGVNTNRQFTVNRNVGSPYHGYVYALDQGIKGVRILRPDPEGAGVDATAYVDTGLTITYEAPTSNDFPMGVFVGSDDTVWVIDYHGKRVVTGPAAGGLFTTQFSIAVKGRGLWVTGALGQLGIRVYCAESEFNVANRAEVYEYKAGGWELVADLGDIGNAWTVAVDGEGNSYWMSVKAPYTMPDNTIYPVVKVKPDFTVDGSWKIPIPSWLGTAFTASAITYVADPVDQSYPEYLYVSQYNPNVVLRFKLDGTYIDSYGSTYNMPGTPPSATWTSIPFAGPGANNTLWIAADTARNSYVQCQMYDGAVYYPVVLKVHLADPPGPPTDLAASNDVYGQVRLQWTPPDAEGVPDKVSTYRIYRSADTTKPDTPYAEVMDAYWKWKDAEQGQAPGSFYYWVASYGAGSESVAAGPVGPVGPVASTAPEPRSKNVAVSYSEYTKRDTVEVAGYDALWEDVPPFLDRRGVDWTQVWDADPEELNIENDDIAGHTLLILPLNRCMSSYGAQCIRDYVKYSGGRLFTGYWNSEASHAQVRQPEFQLADICRVNRAGWDGDWGDWDKLRFRYLQPVAGAQGADVLFEGLPFGATQPSTGTISMLATPYDDGTAVVAGNWVRGDLTGGPFEAGDARNAGLIIGLYNGEPRSVYTHLLWWYRAADEDSVGTFGATRLTENILKFFGIPMSSVSYAGGSVGGSQLTYGDGTQAAFSDTVVSEFLNNEIDLKKYVYVQAEDRSGGIKVVPSGAFATIAPVPGDRWVVSGILDSEFEKPWDGPTTWGDRILKAIEIIPVGPGNPPVPLTMRGSRVVGPWSENGNQQGYYHGPGLNNMGLLATVAGKVTYISNSPWPAGYFYVDDGSGVIDGTTHDNGQGGQAPNIGVRCVMPFWTFGAPPAEFALGKMVSVTGCTSLELVENRAENGIPAVRSASFDQISVLD